MLCRTFMTGVWYTLKRKEARTAGSISGEEVCERKAACWREIKNVYDFGKKDHEVCMHAVSLSQAFNLANIEL